MLPYFVRGRSFVLTEAGLVSNDKEVGVQLEEVVVALAHCPGEGAVADADGVQVRTQARGGHGVLGLGDRHVDRNTGHKT